jgi:TP901 family phage tail tape measure protein
VGDVITTTRLVPDDKRMMRSITKIEKRLAALSKKAIKLPPIKVPPTIGGQPSVGGRPGSRGSSPQMNLDRVIREQKLINQLMDRHKVSAAAAGQAVRMYKGDLDKAGREAAEYAKQLNTAKQRTKELERAQREAGRTAKTSSGFIARNAKAMTGALLTVAAAGMGVNAVIGTLSNSIKTFTGLEDSLLGTKAVTNALTSEMRQLTMQAKALGAATPRTAVEIAGLQQELGRAGFEVREILAAAPGLIAFASAGQLDLSAATSIAAATLRAFGKDVSEIGNVTDILANTSASARTTVEGLSEGMKFAASGAAQLDESLEETAAAIAIIQELGLGEGLAGRGLRGIFAKLANETDESAAVLRELGLTFEQVDLASNSLGESIKLLKDSNIGFGQSVRLVDRESAAALLNLVSGYDRFAKIAKSNTEEAIGSTQRMAEIMESGLGGSLRKMNSALEGAKINFAEGLTPSIQFAAEAMTDFAQGNRELLSDLGQVVGWFVRLGVVLGEIPAKMLAFITAGRLVDSLSEDISELTESVNKNRDAIISWQEAMNSANLEMIQTSILETESVLTKVTDEIAKKQEEIARAEQQASSAVGQLGRGKTDFGVRAAAGRDLEVVKRLEEELAVLEAKSVSAEVALLKLRHAQEAVAKSSKEQGDQTALTADQISELNKLFAEGEAFTKGYETELDRAAAALKTADRLLNINIGNVKESAISQETYNKVLARYNKLAKEAEDAKLNKVFEGVKDEVERLAAAEEIVKRFGISLEEAQKVAEVFAAEGVRGTDEEVVELVKSLTKGKKKLDDLEKSQKSAAKQADKHKEALEAARREVSGLAEAASVMAEFSISQEEATEAAKLMADANISLADALEIVQAKAQQLAAIERNAAESLSNMLVLEAQEAAAIIDGLTTRTQAFRDELAKIRNNPILTAKQKKDATDALKDQMEGWELVASAAEESAERAGGAWGRVLGGIAGNMEKIGGLFGTLSTMVEGHEGGPTLGSAALGGIATGIQEGNIGAGAMSFFQGAAAASGVGQQSVSQFGGLSEGNFMMEGLQAGAMFGPVGALVGGLVGGLVKKGADDMKAAISKEFGDFSFDVSVAEGGLADFAAEFGSSVEGMLNTLQDSVLADLDFGEFGISVEVRGRELTVIAGNVRRVFTDANEAQAFILESLLALSWNAENLGDNMRDIALSIRGAGGSLEEIQAAIGLAQRMDFAETGVNEAAIRARQEELRLVGQFGIDADKYLAFRRKELDLQRQAMQISVDSALGARDFTSGVMGLVEGMRVFNNTSEADRSTLEARRVELERLIDTGGEQVVAAQETANANNVAAESEKWKAKSIDVGNDMTANYTDEQHRANEALADAKDQVVFWERELNVVKKALNEAKTATFEHEQAVRLQTAAMGQASLDLIDKLRNATGNANLFAEEEAQIRQDLARFELMATISQAQIMMQTFEFVTEAAREMFQSVVDFGTQILNDPNFKFDTRGARGGGGRRGEQRRRAEEAAKAVGEFNEQLRVAELNTSSFSGALGDLSARLRQITADAAAAAAAGADPADVRRMQQLGFRGERESLLGQFEREPRNLTEGLIDIERIRRDALAQAEMIAHAQAEALGVSFESVFGPMEETINRGTWQMEMDLRRGMIEALNLPLESARHQLQEVKRANRDLAQARQQGLISEREFISLQRQLVEEQDRLIGGEIFGLLDQYYGEVAGKEELRRQQAIVNFELELAMARLRFNQLQAEGLILSENLQQYEDFLTFMEQNPPDWDTLLGTDDLQQTTSSMASSAGAFSSAANTAAQGFQSLVDAIQAFINSMENQGVGQFTQMANNFLQAIEGFQTDIGQGLSSMLDGFTVGQRFDKIARMVFGPGSTFATLTDAQLQTLADMESAGTLQTISGFQEGMEGMLDAILLLQDAEGFKPKAIQDIIAAYQGTVDSTNELQSQFDSINSEYDDALNAMMLMGASAMDLALIEQTRQERMLQFWDNALSSVRDLEAEIRGGAFGGRRQIDIVADLRAEYESLQARLAADPMDFEALSLIAQAGRDLIEAERDFTGGFGPEYNRIMQEILGDLEAINAPDAQDVLESRHNDTLAAMNAQLSAMEGTRSASEDMLDEIRGLREDNADMRLELSMLRETLSGPTELPVN